MRKTEKGMGLNFTHTQKKHVFPKISFGETKFLWIPKGGNYSKEQTNNRGVVRVLTVRVQGFFKAE